MSKLCKGLIAGAVAALALAAPAHARENVRTMTIVLPDGGVARVHYAGEAPRVVIAPAAPVQFAPAPAFSRADQIAAAMERRMALMMARAEMMRRQATQNTSSSRMIAAGRAPAGVCMQSVQIIQVAGQAPQVVRRTYGDCAAPNAPASAARRAVSPPRHSTPAPDLLDTI